jgi:hypothetical protein
VSSSLPPPDPGPPTGGPLSRPDAALAAAVSDDEDAPFDLEALAAEIGATPALLASIERAGLLLPHHLDETGTARYSRADAEAVRGGLALVDAGLPLGELLDLGRRTDAAVREIAEHAVDAFLRFVRDPVHGTVDDEVEASDRLVTAYRVMLPATERLVAHHTRRRLLAAAAERVAREVADGAGNGARNGAEDGTGGGPTTGAHA